MIVKRHRNPPHVLIQINRFYIKYDINMLSFHKYY